MFCIYADGDLLYYPPSDDYAVQSPKLTLEMGKAGSLTFGLLPSNAFYGQLRKLKTLITVEYDGEEIFRGRVLSEERSFNNTISYYCEGDLSYLVDSVQSNDAFEGKVHDLFTQMIQNHNAMVEPEKQFLVGDIDVENRDVLISGVSEDIENAETGGFNYKQIAINSTTSDWETTYDRINSTIIEYTGGYLRTRRGQGGIYVDLLLDYGNQTAQAIEFGVNLLDLTEEISAEDLFTVLIPLGDENLTIASVNGGSNELVDSDAVAIYGRIVRTNVFSGVTDAATLLENGQRYLENNVNVPVTITVKAVDMHIVDPNTDDIHVGDRVYVNSQPHSIIDTLVCTRISYDLENAANNEYTFGNPIQTLTQRYRKSMKQVEQDAEEAAESAVGGGGGGGGGGAGAAAEEAEKNLKEFYDAWINVDPEHAQIDLGALSRIVDDMKNTLTTQVGLKFDGATGNINLLNVRTLVDENNQQIYAMSNQLNSMQLDFETKLQLFASYVGSSGGNDQNYAELDIGSGRIGAYIASIVADQNETYSSRLTQLSNGIYGTIEDKESDLRALITANTNAIDLRITQGKLESYVNLSGGIVSIGGQRINLNGLVYVEDLEAVKARITNLTSGFTSADHIVASTVSCQSETVAGHLRVYSFQIGNDNYNPIQLSNSFGYYGYVLGKTNVSLAHSHAITADADANGNVTITLGMDQATEGTANFNIADTQFFKDRVSAASVETLTYLNGGFFDDDLSITMTAKDASNKTIKTEQVYIPTSIEHLSGSTYKLTVGTASRNVNLDIPPAVEGITYLNGGFIGTDLSITFEARDPGNNVFATSQAYIPTSVDQVSGGTYRLTIGSATRDFQVQLPPEVDSVTYLNGGFRGTDLSLTLLAKDSGNNTLESDQVYVPTSIEPVSGNTYKLTIGTATRNFNVDSVALDHVNVSASSFSGTNLQIAVEAFDGSNNSMGSKTGTLSTGFTYNSSNANGYTYNFTVGGQTRSVSAQQAYNNGVNSVSVYSVSQVAAPTLSGTTYTLYLRGTASNQAYKDETITLDASAVAAGVKVPTLTSVNVTSTGFSGTTLQLGVDAYDENGSRMSSTKNDTLSTGFTFDSGNANGYTYNFVVGGQSRSVSALAAYNNGVSSVTVTKVEQTQQPSLSGTTYTLYLRGTASNGLYKDETITLDASAVAAGVTIPTVSNVSVTAGAFSGTNLPVTATAYDENGNSMGSGQASLATNFTFNSSNTNGYTYNFTVGGQTRSVSAQQAYNNGVSSVTVHSVSQVAAPTLNGTTYTLYLRGTASNENYKDQTITLDAKAVADAVQITGAMISAVTLTIGNFSGTSLPTVLRVVSSDGRVIKEINGSIATDFQKGSGDNEYIFSVDGKSRTVNVEGASGTIDGSMIQTVNVTPITYNGEILRVRLSVVSSEGAVVKEVTKDIDASFMSGGGGGEGTSDVSYVQATTDGFDGDTLLLNLQAKSESGVAVVTSQGRLATSITKVEGTVNSYTLKIGGATRTVNLGSGSGSSGGGSGDAVSYIQATTSGFDNDTLLLNLQGKTESGDVIVSSGGRLATSITPYSGNTYILKIGSATRQFQVSGGSSASVDSVTYLNGGFSGTQLSLTLQAKDSNGTPLKSNQVYIPTDVTISGTTVKLTIGSATRQFQTSSGGTSTNVSVSSCNVRATGWNSQYVKLDVTASLSNGSSKTSQTTMFTNLKHDGGADYTLQVGEASRPVTCQKAYDAGYSAGKTAGANSFQKEPSIYYTLSGGKYSKVSKTLYSKK